MHENPFRVGGNESLKRTLVSLKAVKRIIEPRERMILIDHQFVIGSCLIDSFI